MSKKRKRKKIRRLMCRMDEESDMYLVLPNEPHAPEDSIEILRVAAFEIEAETWRIAIH